MNKFFSALPILLVLGMGAVALQSCSTASNTFTTNYSSAPTLLSLNNQNISKDEFEYLYRKNNAIRKDSLWTEENVREYLDLYINFKLKVEEAKALGMDTAQSFVKEFDSYKNQLAEPYLTPKNVTQQLVKEAYERLQEAIRASHILIMVDQYADPKDTLAAYTKIKELRKRALEGEDFAELARQHSDDPSGKINGGDLYYFSALQMVYPFETAAYQTPKNKISPIVRTRFGSHILKVTDRKPSLGKVELAHIMMRSSDGMFPEDTLKAYRKIQEIYTQLQNGEDFEQLAAQFSEDYRSRQLGGKILNNNNPVFTSGTLIPPFEEQISRLKENEITKPFKSAFGWHIVKLLSKKPIEPFSELAPVLEQKIAKDSRAEVQKAVLIAKLKKENGFVQHKAIEEILQHLSEDSTLTTTDWTLEQFLTQNPSIKSNRALFTVGKEKNYFLEDFGAYLQNKLPLQTNSLPLLRRLLDEFQSEKIIDYEKELLPIKYPEYRFLLQEYYDGILLFKIMEQNVWGKALADQAGLMEFYEKNKEKYRWEDRAKAIIFNVADKETLRQLKDSLNLGYYAIPNFATLRFDWQAKATTLTESDYKKLEPYLIALDKNPSFVMTIDIAKAIGETDKHLNIRLDSLKAKMKLRGIDESRIVAIRKGDAKSVRAAMQIQLWTTDEKVLENRFNQENALRLQVKKGLFEQEDIPILQKIDFQKGEYTVEENGRIFYILIEDIEPARIKELDETRGMVISDYQKYLEQIWIQQLRAKYKVEINEKLLQDLINKNT